MTAPNRTQIRIPVNAVNALAEQCTTIESRVISPQAAALTVRMVSPFGYILKCSGEAAVADVSFSDPTFARNMATERVKAAATPEIWAHEGWHMMKVMNSPDVVIAPTIANAIHATLPHLLDGQAKDPADLLATSTVIIYRIASNHPIDTDMLLSMGDFHARPDFKHDADTLQRAADTLTNVCRGIMLGYASRFDGDLLAYWSEAKYKLSLGASDIQLDAMQRAWYPALNLLVANMLEDIQHNLRREVSGNNLMSIHNIRYSKHILLETVALMLKHEGSGVDMPRVQALSNFLSTVFPSLTTYDHDVMAIELVGVFDRAMAEAYQYVNVGTIQSILCPNEA